MTLNASGPLSFGGSTVGQSINLELGQSATALASINATNFRTLAGVASGQISISNFYGKSNSIGWVAYLGNAYASGGLNQGPFYVDGASNYYWSFAQTNTSYYGLGKLSSSGNLSTYIFPFTAQTFYISTGGNRSSSAYVSVGYQATGGAQMLYGSSLNRLYPGTLRPQTGTYNVEVYGPGVVTSGGELVITGKLSGLTTLGIIKYSADGTSAVEKSFTSPSNGYLKVLLRTDGTIVLLSRTSGGLYATHFSSSLTPIGTWYVLPVTGFGTGQDFGAVIGASNELFFALTASNCIVRYDSSYNMTHRITLNATAFGWLLVGIATYGSYVYTLTYSYTDMYLTCLSTSDLSIQWTNKFTWSGGNVETVGVGSALYATSEGIFFTMIQSGSGPVMAIKVPLTGMPTASSVAVSGTAGTLSWTKPVYTITQQSVGSTSTYTDTASTRTPSATTVPAAGSSIAPTATRTLIV